MRKRLLYVVALLSGAVALAQLLRSRKDEAAGGGVTVTGAMARNVAVAKTGARVGASYAAHQAKRATASPEKQAELDAAFELKTAEEVVNVLGNMKGALMKLGQMASFLDDGLPEPIREALATLQADAPPMSASLAADVVEQELGAAPDDIFAEWDEAPLSAASIGQVHRAVTKDGVPVAVKVQYPGVAKAIMSDLDNSQILFTVLGMVFPGLDPQPIVTELRERLGEEVDYRIEARNQTEFHRWYVDHPFIHVPSVLEEYSSERVLTTELAHGARFAEVAGTWTREQQNLAAESIYRFVFRSLWAFGAFNGDPHPGNYLFRPDGRVTFLDFGLVKRFSESHMRQAQKMIEAIVFEDDTPKFRRVIEEQGILAPNAPITDAEVERYFAYFYELVRKPGPQTVTHEYAAGMVDQFFNPSQSPVVKVANLGPDFVILQRINLGLYAILARLEAHADWRAISSELWSFVDGAPSTELGREEAAWAAKLKR